MIYDVKQYFDVKSVKRASYRKAVPRTRKNGNYIVPEDHQNLAQQGVNGICNTTLWELEVENFVFSNYYGCLALSNVRSSHTKCSNISTSEL